MASGFDFKRIQRELHSLLNDPPPSCSAALADDGNFLHLSATIKGPPDSPYEGGEFHLSIELINYPVNPPYVTFRTLVYHPNISFLGSVCLGILSNEWSPDYTIGQVLLTIYCLLMDPNYDDPWSQDVGKLYKENREKYYATAREWTQKYAIPPDIEVVQPAVEPDAKPAPSFGKQKNRKNCCTIS